MKNLGLAVSFAMLASVPAASQSRSAAADVPDVRVWLEQSSFRYGDLIRPSVTTDRDAYLTVFRVTTDGELRVLYPAYPDEQEPYLESRFANDLVPVQGPIRLIGAEGSGPSSFYARESTGNGFVFAVASYYKFNFGYYTTSGKQWSTTRLANASRFGSPFQIVRSFVEEITEGSSSYSMDYVMYDVNANQSYSRYATRYRTYGYDDYYDLCLSAFGNYYTGSCRGYYGGYYYPGLIVVNAPSRGGTGNGPGSNRRMTKPLVVDPVVPNVPREPVPAEGRVAPNDDREAAAIARRERALREAKPRVDPMQAPHRAEPEPQVLRTQAPRPEPRMDAPRPEPRVSAPREMHSAPPRVEVRNEPPRQAPPPPPPPKPVDRPQKDNGN